MGIGGRVAARFLGAAPDGGFIREAKSITPEAKVEITGIAKSVRQKLGQCELACINHSIVLRDALRDAGYDAVRVFGYMQVDGNWRDQWGSGPVDWMEDDPTVEWNMDHNWVEIDGQLVVDTGAEQFNPLMKSIRFPPVYVASWARAKRHIGKETVGGGYKHHQFRERPDPVR